MDALHLPTSTGYTDVTSLLIIMVCAVGMAVFLYLFSMAGDLPHRPVNFGPQQRNMVKVCNPFVLELDESNLKDPLRLSLSILSPCHVIVVWGPMIQALHDLILLPGRDVRRKLLSDLEGSTSLEPLHWDVLMFEVEGKHNVTLQCPESVTSEALGEMPRSRYPASVFMFTPEKSIYCQDKDDDDDESMRTTQNNECTENGSEEPNDNMIIGLFAILHLRDSVVTKNSHIIAKYVKTAGIPIYSLQALFMSSSDQHQQETPHRETMDSNQHCSQAVGPSISTDVRLRKIPDPLPNKSQNVCDNDGANNINNVFSRDTDDYEICGDTSLPCDVPSTETHCASMSLPECVVCQSRPAKCVLLPCRHNCVCTRCLRLLDNKCPICRGTVESYFIVTQEDDECSDCLYEDEDEEIDENAEMIQGLQRQGLAAHMENFFERVNHMVGFT